MIVMLESRCLASDLSMSNPAQATQCHITGSDSTPNISGPQAYLRSVKYNSIEMNVLLYGLPLEFRIIYVYAYRRI